MFYSHAFLARKGPLATVWMAAHLESRLRKSHLKKTDIHSFINTIMFPEVPIALRLSGHLLLGVVRIYSKKVDYLYHDYNEFAAQIRTFFAPAQINLPEDANCATYQSVTLPETFDLDALEMADDVADLLKSKNDHVKPLEDITLQDQIPAVEVPQYIPFYLSEDSTDSSSFSGRQSLGVMPMGEETLPPFPADISIEIFPEERMDGSGNQDASRFGRSPHVSRVPTPNLDGFVGTETSPDFGVMRDADRCPGVDIAEEIIAGVGYDGKLQHQQENLNDGDVRMEDVVPVDGHLPVLQESPSSPARQNLPNSASADAIPVHDNSAASAGQPIPEVELQPSPPVRRRQNARKRKGGSNLFEENIVLTNAEMKKQLKDSENLVCKRRKLPCSTLDVWKFQCRLHLEHTFQVPSLSGMSYELKEICLNKYSALVTKNLHAELHEDIGAVSPVEHPRFDGSTNENLCETMRAVTTSSLLEQMQPSGPCINENLLGTVGTDNPVSPLEQLRLDNLSEGHLSKERPSPSGMETTPVRPTDQVSVSQGERTLESDVPWTANTDYLESGVPQFGTPHYDHRDQTQTDVHLAEIPSTSRSPASDDLNFLEAERTAEGSERSVNMSARTRAVAHYFKEQSPGDLVSNKSGALSLNKILEGKKRKHCARMFFETLVLKSYDYIYVYQKEAFGDVTVSLTPALSKMLF